MKVYYNPQAPVGSYIKGKLLKEMIALGWIGFEGATIDGTLYSKGDVSPDEICDDEAYIIALNTNCNAVEVIQLFTETKVVIHTGMKPEGAIGEDGLPLKLVAQ